MEVILLERIEKLGQLGDGLARFTLYLALRP